VFGAAPLGKPNYVDGYIRPDDLILCADGGLARARALGLTPHALIGDADSGGRLCPGADVVLLPREKDQTDMNACLDYALAKGCDEFFLFGASGGSRLDHFLGNIGLLEYCADRGARALMADARHEMFLHTGGLVILPDPEAFRYLSILPLDRVVEHVTLRGLRYPLTDGCLSRSSARGVSNEPLGAHPIEITLTGHALLVRSERRRNQN
jgi:thiamine pyrophosphokinase